MEINETKSVRVDTMSKTQTTEETENTEQTQNNSRSIFSKYDTDDEKGIITKEEMGINKILDKILKALPESVQNSIIGRAILSITSMVEKLGTNITYNPEDVDTLDVDTEIENRIVDANILLETAKKMKKDQASGVNQLGEIGFVSKAGKDALDENYAKTEAQAIVKNAVDNGLVDNHDNINLQALSTKQMPGLAIKDVKIKKIYNATSGLENDYRDEQGRIHRRVDDRVVSVTFNYKDKEFKVSLSLGVPENYIEMSIEDPSQDEITTSEDSEIVY